MGDFERDVEVTSALLNVDKKKRLKASALTVLVNTWLFYVTFAGIPCLSENRTKNGFGFFLTFSLNVVLF